jgi:hypothetical protein
MIIVQKQYLPFVENWNEANEYPRKKHESNHTACRYYDPINNIMGYCTRRHVKVIKTHLHCKQMQDKEIYFIIGNNTPICIAV